MVMRRVSSAPMLLVASMVAAVADDEEDEGHRRNNSNGCGASSPTAHSTLARMWYDTLNKALTVAPRLVVQDMGNRIFVGVYLWPRATFDDGAPLNAIHRNRWHSSLATAYWAAELAWREVNLGILH